MAKGQHLSQHQQKIVSRYYANLDTIALGRLSESVSDLFLCTDPKKAEKLWKSVETALGKTDAKDTRVQAILATRDIKQLAALVNELSAKS